MSWYLFNSIGGGTWINYVWWGITVYCNWGKVRKFRSFICGCAIYFSAYNALIGISAYLAGGSSNIGFWQTAVLSCICAFTLANFGANRMEGLGIRSSIMHAAIQGIVLVGIFSLLIIFMVANLRMESEIARAFISGCIYPGAEMFLKFIFRKANLSASVLTAETEADMDIRELAFVYIGRNLEIALGTPNFFLIYLLDSRNAFLAAVAGLCTGDSWTAYFEFSFHKACTSNLRGYWLTTK